MCKNSVEKFIKYECIKDNLNKCSDIPCLYIVRFTIVEMPAFLKLIYEFSEICITITTEI